MTPTELNALLQSKMPEIGDAMMPEIEDAIALCNIFAENAGLLDTPEQRRAYVAGLNDGLLIGIASIHKAVISVLDRLPTP